MDSASKKKKSKMGLQSTSNRLSYSYYEYLLNSTNYSIETISGLSEAENAEANNNLIEGHAYLELEKKTMFPVNTTDSQKRGRRAITSTAATSSIVTTYTNPVEYQYPLTLNECFPINPYSLTQVPIVIPPPNYPQLTQFPPSLLHPVLPPIPETFIQEDMINFTVTDFMNMYCMLDQSQVVTEDIEQPYYIQEIDNTAVNDVMDANTSNIENQAIQGDPLDQYLALPRQLFPTARMLALDPNPLINEFCKMPNLLQHTPWLLDLEFGIPKTPVTRPIPIYNVKYNSINCKNTPNAIHPGFEMCDPDFKKVLLFYYDYIVSAWYRGYVITNSDRSVENFQSWLLSAMKVLGMCWP